MFVLVFEKKAEKGQHVEITLKLGYSIFKKQ